MTTRAEYQENEREKLPLVSDRFYTLLRRLVEYVLPGSSALYLALAEIWGLPYATEVVGTIAAVTVFLGIFVGFSRKVYNESDAAYDGTMIVDTRDPMKDNVQLDISSAPQNLMAQKQVVFKVHHIE